MGTVQKEERRVAMEDFIVLLVKREAVAKDGRLRSDITQFIRRILLEGEVRSRPKNQNESMNVPDKRALGVDLYGIDVGARHGAA